MLSLPLDKITLEDLERLVTDGVRESTRIEYKRTFYDMVDPAKRDGQIEEMIKDISAFANTEGGDLIFGMEAKDGVPSKVCGFEEKNPDGLKLKIDSLVQRWIELRMAIAIKEVPMGSDRIVLVIRILQSLISPHRVVYQNRPGQFYGRNSAGTFSMDTTQLRQAFTFSASVLERIKDFKEHRVQPG